MQLMHRCNDETMVAISGVSRHDCISPRACYDRAVGQHTAATKLTASTISARLPRRTTGSIWRKSPASSNTIPPSSLSVFIMSGNVRSSASNRCLCDIGASSHTMSFVWRRSSAVALRGVMLHVEFSSTGIGSLNRECAVRPNLRHWRHWRHWRPYVTYDRPYVTVILYLI